MKEKKVLSAEDIYKKNKRKAKNLKIMTPLVFWTLLLLTLIFFCLMIQNSVGNVTEILRLLDDEIYTSTEIQENYKMLVEKWGEWEIIGADSAGLVVRYVDIRNALFSGLMITYMILCIVSFVLAFLLGKIVLPTMRKYYETNNDEIVDMATLKTAAKIDEKINKKEWF